MAKPPDHKDAPEPTDAEVEATIVGQHREMYDDRLGPASRKKTIFDFYKNRLIQANKEKQEKLQSELEKTGEALDFLRRAREKCKDDPDKLATFPPDNAPTEQLLTWYEEARKPNRNIPFANPSEDWLRQDRISRAIQSGQRPDPEDLAEQEAERVRYQRRLAEAFENKSKQLESEFSGKPDYGNPPDSELGLNFVRNSKTREVRPRAKAEDKALPSAARDKPLDGVFQDFDPSQASPLIRRHALIASDDAETDKLLEETEGYAGRGQYLSGKPGSKWYQKFFRWVGRHQKQSLFWSGLAMAGFALATELSSAPKLGLLFYFIALVIWCWFVHANLWRKSRLGSVLIMVCLAVAIGLFWWGLLPDKESTDEIAEKIVKRLNSPELKRSPLSPPEGGQRAVAILPQYEIRVLPILIEAGETSYFLPLNLTLKEGLVSRGNGTTKPMWWPAEKAELQKGGYGIEMVSRCTLKNYSETVLLNPIMSFEISFYEGNSSQGKLISRHTHQVSIPVLEKEKPFIFYIVNQTPYFALVDFPKEIEIEVVGESNRRTVPLVQPKTIDQLLQNMPSGQYGPSLIDWTRF